MLDHLLIEVLLNRIEELSTCLTKNAEKKCRKFRTSEVYFSLEVAKASKTWILCECLLSYKLQKKNCFAVLVTLDNDLNIADFDNIILEKIKYIVTRSRCKHLKLKFQLLHFGK